MIGGDGVFGVAGVGLRVVELMSLLFTSVVYMHSSLSDGSVAESGAREPGVIFPGFESIFLHQET